jgi:hypothetical protein
MKLLFIKIKNPLFFFRKSILGGKEVEADGSRWKEVEASGSEW